ncbi:MAG: hypothetical protein AB1424_13925 [Thermodesulfobacteriota bacterium]
MPLVSSDQYNNRTAALGGDNHLVFNPEEDVEAVLPDMRDLPMPASLKKGKNVRLYTGIIKNKTRYDVEVPSSNSGAILIIPAKGWIEYNSWVPRFDLTAYRDGKPFYCMKIFANPKSYPFMCQKYDFMIEIVKAEPKAKKKMKRAIKKKKLPGAVEGLG